MIWPRSDCLKGLLPGRRNLILELAREVLCEYRYGTSIISNQHLQRCKLTMIKCAVITTSQYSQGYQKPASSGNSLWCLLGFFADTIVL